MSELSGRHSPAPESEKVPDQGRPIAKKEYQQPRRYHTFDDAQALGCILAPIAVSIVLLAIAGGGR